LVDVPREPINGPLNSLEELKVPNDGQLGSKLRKDKLKYLQMDYNDYLKQRHYDFLQRCQEASTCQELLGGEEFIRLKLGEFSHQNAVKEVMK
jgi:hypothetical protein